MNVLQRTRNERNPCLKQDRADRSYRDTLLTMINSASRYKNSAYFTSILYLFFKLFFPIFFGFFQTISNLFSIDFKPIILKQKIVRLASHNYCKDSFKIALK